MMIKLKSEAVCGKVSVPAGEYLVSLHPETSEIHLAGGGKDYRLKATKRRSLSRAKIVQHQFFCGGGRIWSLVISTPKQGEWISLLECNPSSLAA